MTKINDGGPAFPYGAGQPYFEPGMSLRDWFAGQAMIGMLHPEWDDNAVNQPHLMAKEAYRVADAMLAERSKGGT